MNNTYRTIILGGALLICLARPLPATAQSTIGWDLTGGPVWEKRLGPGITLAIGGNDCTDRYCNGSGYLETSFAGSIAATVGFVYRIIPNLAVFADLHGGYLNTGYDWLYDDDGLLAQVTVGAEFHAPITGWLEAYIGFGLGYAYLGTWGQGKSEVQNPVQVGDGDDYHSSLHGVNFEFKTGVDVYPFSQAPTLGGGPIFRLGLPYWVEACVENSGCGIPDGLSHDDLPFTVFLGLATKYGF